MIISYEAKGKQFDIMSYTVERVTQHIAELLEVDKVITGYPASSNDAIRSISASQTEDVWTLSNFTYPLPGKKDLSFIALDRSDSKAVAYMIASLYNDGKRAHLNRIAVLEQYQRFGLGRQLMGLLESQSKGLGVGEITLSTMYKEGHMEVVQWYESLGYKIMKTEEEVRAFLDAKNKTGDFEKFWPWNGEGKLLNMYKKL